MNIDASENVDDVLNGRVQMLKYELITLEQQLS